MSQRPSVNETTLFEQVKQRFEQLSVEYGYNEINWNEYYSHPDTVLPDGVNDDATTTDAEEPNKTATVDRRISVIDKFTREQFEGIVDDEDEDSAHLYQQEDLGDDDEEEEEDSVNSGTDLTFDEEDDFIDLKSSENNKQVNDECSHNIRNNSGNTVINLDEDEEEEYQFERKVNHLDVDVMEQDSPSPVVKKRQKKKKKTATTITTDPNSPPSLTKHQFTRQRDTLILKYYVEFNQRIFGNRLPTNMTVKPSSDKLDKSISSLPSPYLKWNKTLRKTAGITKMFIRNSDQWRSIGIELSTKVCDNVERLRKTLAHEMCHAATFLFHGVKGHGQLFFRYGNLVTEMYPDIPVTTCHSYEIQYKHIYKCTNCYHLEKRHTKSLNLATHKCKICSRVNTYELQNQNGSAVGLNQYNLYVKENYARVQASNPNAGRKELMSLVAKEYKLTKNANNDTATVNK